MALSAAKERLRSNRREELLPTETIELPKSSCSLNIYWCKANKKPVSIMPDPHFPPYLEGLAPQTHGVAILQDLPLAEVKPVRVHAQGHFADVLCQCLHEPDGSFSESL